MPSVNIRPSEARELSWRKVNNCKNFDGTVSIEDAINKAGLDYKVESQPLIRVPQYVVDAIMRGESFDFAPTFNNVIKSHKSTFRTDSDVTLGVTGANYGIVDNTKAFEFIKFIKEV